MYRIDYLIEKYKQAVFILATGEGDARSRVGKAYFCFWHICITEYPPNLHREVESIIKMLTRQKGRNEYIISDNLRNMKNKTASKIAETILDVYFKLVEYSNK